jgi:hypothetical protein
MEMALIVYHLNHQFLCACLKDYELQLVMNVSVVIGFEIVEYYNVEESAEEKFVVVFVEADE